MRKNSAHDCQVVIDVRHKLFELASLQQVGSRSLFAANCSTELRDEESCFQRFGEGPASSVTPFMGQSGIFLFDRNDIARDLDCNSLPSERGVKVGPGRFSVAVETNQRQEPGKHIQQLGALVFSL